MRIAENAPRYRQLPRRALNLRVRADLIDEAKAAGLNLSQLTEAALEQALREIRGRRWQEENAEAIAYHRARVEREGMWHEGLSPWY
jgi:antitoxin CcdA